MKNLIFILFLGSSLCSFGQDYFYLEDIRLRKKSDFLDNESEAIKAIDYLMSTPVNKNNLNRKACTRFIIKYAEKTPFITMTLDETVSKVYTGNLDLLSMYIGLWLKSAINDKDKSDEFYQEYILDQLSIYCNGGNGIVQNEVIKKLVKAGKSDAVKDFMKDLKE